MSVSAMLDDLEREGISLSLDGENLRYRCSRGALPPSRREQLVAHKAEIMSELLRRSETPRLSNLQQAYWLGEQSAFRYSAPAYVHLVYDFPEVEFSRLRDAAETMMGRHPPLRLRITDQGRAVLAGGLSPPVIALDVGDKDPRRCEATGNPRDFLQRIDIGPPFTLVLAEGRKGKALHAFLRLLVFDAPAVGVFMDDLAMFCDAGTLAPRVTAYEGGWTSSPEDTGCQDVLERLSGPPVLPLLHVNDRCRSLTFSRLSGCLDQSDFQSLRSFGREFGVSLNAVLYQAYADTLRRWSEAPQFDLNVMISNRHQSSIGSGAIWNYARTALVPIGVGESFIDRTLSANALLFEVLDRRGADGVATMRAMSAAGRRPDPREPVSPFVFSTQLEEGARAKPAHQKLGWRLVASSMSTPQVWLDHQVFEASGKLCWNFDAADRAFCPGVVQLMAEYYGHFLLDLARERAAWTRRWSPALPPKCMEARVAANATDLELPCAALHEGLWRRAEATPGSLAFVSSEASLSFREVANLASALGQELISRNLRPGDRVLIHGEKTIWAAVAMMGVLCGGGVYVPLTADTPIERLRAIAEDAEAGIVLSDDRFCLDSLESDGFEVLDHAAWLRQADPGGPLQSMPREPVLDALAYVIFTSGSTGRPKGVAITHQAAANTIQDVLRRFEITEDDRLLCISAIGFDLSVFDIFAPCFGAGPTIFPQDSNHPDPMAWLEAAKRFGATVWNSAPSILEMMAEYLIGPEGELRPTRSDKMPRQLRLFMASGDWIPLTLPDRLRNVWQGARFFSLGGATEASIWSNFFEVESIDPSWRSIPYGQPLANQRLHVFDSDGRHVPPLVPGHLMISGSGLARGYFGDQERTEESFRWSDEVGARVYDTGDMARYLPNGCVEILGRKDLQVKVRGFRVELGEIEHVLERHPAVARAAVALESGTGSDPEVIAVVKWADQPDAEDLERHAAVHLPKYMVPRRFVATDDVPLTSNGKLDRKRIAELAKAGGTARDAGDAPPESSLERRIAELWSGVLGAVPNSRHQRFDLAGGDSLRAVQLLNRLEDEFDRRFSLAALYQHPTVAEQAKLIESGANHRSSLVRLGPTGKTGSASTLILIHPVGGSIACYASWPGILDDRVALYGLANDERHVFPSVEAMSSAYARQIMTLGCDAPWVGGWSMGGILALAVACVLEQEGIRVAGTIMIDPWQAQRAPAPAAISDRALAEAFAGDLTAGVSKRFDGIADDADLDQLLDGIIDLCDSAGHQIPRSVCASRFDIFKRNYRALLDHVPEVPKRSRLALFRATANDRPSTGLVPFTGPAAFKMELPVDHYEVMEGSSLESIVADIDRFLKGGLGN